MAVRLHRLLGRAIVRGDYETQPFPNEKELSERFQASRTVTREAVKILSAKGMVSSRTKTGTKVEPIDHWNVLDPELIRWLMEQPASHRVYRELNQMRLAIEPMAAGLAAQVGDPSAVKEIGDALADMKAAGTDRKALFLADSRFHAAILKGSGNSFFWRLKALIEAGLYRASNGTESSIDITLSDAVYAAVRDGDSGQAELAMRWLLVKVAKMTETSETVAEKPAMVSQV